jgi:hypothetical protein
VSPTIISSRNQYRVTGKDAILTITRRNWDTYDIVFNRADLDRIQRNVWRVADGNASHQVETGRDAAGTLCPLTHLIAGTPKKGHVVFHADGDWRNCRRSNLRHGTRQQVQHRRQTDSGHGYVSWHLKDRRWYAYGRLDGQKIYLGGWSSRDEAVEARQRWQSRHEPNKGKK